MLSQVMYDRDEVAKRTGVNPEYVDRLHHPGILHGSDDGSYSSGDVRRVALVQNLEDAGLPLTEIGRTDDTGELSDGVNCCFVTNEPPPGTAAHPSSGWEMG
jgi:DNA-binding transcriptional MerR regulator